ncbi:MAG: GspE/PulE family protein [Deltaproteobacteria bacterium]
MSSQYLDNDSYLPDLLLRKRIITPEQQKLIRLKKDIQRQRLMKSRLHRRKTDSSQVGWSEEPDFLDILLSFNLESNGGEEPYLTEDVVMRAMAEDLGLPFKKLDPLELDLDVVTKTIPKSFAINHMLLPFARKNGVLAVATCDPAKKEVLGEIERVNQIKVEPYLTTKSDIKKILGEFYGFQSSITAAESHLGGPMVDISNLEQYVRVASTEEAAMSDKHIQKAVDHLFSYAFEQRASDIHIEPKRKHSLVRLRIDGTLHTIYTLPRVVHPAIVSRIKFLSRLDIAEKRRPQDGRIKVDRGGKEAEIRVSTVPVAFGEKVVLRILDPEIIFQQLDQLGFAGRDYSVFQETIKAPYGIFLVTGPTGSGKSTTLYSTLKSVSSPGINIITIEDPVEMVYEDFNQIAVQPHVEVTFSSILRNILRQDPDIIMIGEIRDRETASHAVQAALTGHLVFSTLHTNDAISSVTRLLDLGIQPFLVASTLIGAMAQRLVRKICPHCKEQVMVDSGVLAGFGFPATPEKETPLYQGKGCRHCRNTGYYGRCGIFEIFPMSDRLQLMTSNLAAEADIRKVAVQEGMTSLKDDVWRKMLDGVTTCEEAVRVVGS